MYIMCTIFNLNFHSFLQALVSCMLWYHRAHRQNTSLLWKHTLKAHIRQTSSIQFACLPNFGLKSSIPLGKSMCNSHILLYHGSFIILKVFHHLLHSPQSLRPKSKSRRFRLTTIAQLQLQVLGLRPYLVGRISVKLDQIGSFPQVWIFSKTYSKAPPRYLGGFSPQIWKIKTRSRQGCSHHDDLPPKDRGENYDKTPLQWFQTIGWYIIRKKYTLQTIFEFFSFLKRNQCTT